MKMVSKKFGSKPPIKRRPQIALRGGCKGGITSAYQQVATRVRRLKLKHSWSKLGIFYPGLTRATLRKIVADKTYQPKEPKILLALGLSPLPAVVHDVLAIIYSGAPPVMRDRRRK